ncbi:hypothetical protein ACJZ2D_014875 [Fusarium nematophilum]
MVSSFRPIKPAVQQSLQRRDVAGPIGAVAPCDKLGKRIRSVAQACLDCRQNKVKVCDGRRPQCGTCAARLRLCRYESKVSQPKRAALKSRLQAFEKVFSALQAKSVEDAGLLLQQIRSTDDIVSLLDLKGDVSSPSISGSTTTSPSDSKFSSPTVGTVSEEQSVRSSPSACENPSAHLLHKSAPDLEKANLPTSAPIQREPSIHAPTSLISLILPSASTTEAAVESFFSSSGRLFHVFSREQASNYHNAIFRSDGCTLPSQKTAICCLAAVAAVGVQYNGDNFDAGIESVFYDVARHFFETLMEEQPLDAIKTCTLLAMYNIMNKATVSLAYIDIGLSMSKRHGLNEKCHHHPGLSQDDWIDYRRTWRTLIWLSSTLGYIRSGDISFRQLAPLVDVDSDHSCEISHMVQTEMTKISLLNADILRMRLTSGEITTKAMDFIDKDLQDWHDLLPSQMHLPNLCRQELPVEARRSILATHLLYLGTRMLLYRRIASQFVRSAAAAQENNIVLTGYEDKFLNHADQGLTAARQSARILGLLQAEQGIFKRCWLIIFQSYTSCVVLLHCVAQKQVHDFPPSTWQDDLAQARVCLDVISFCSTLDSVARKFRDCVLPIHDKLASYNRPTASKSTLQSSPSLVYMLRVPTAADTDRVSLSLKLLMILCQPFSNLNGECGLNGDFKPSLPNTPAQLEKPQPGDTLNWRLEGCLPFRWDPQDVGLGASVLLEGDCRFLGSHQPSGWAGVGIDGEWEEPDSVSGWVADDESAIL